MACRYCASKRIRLAHELPGLLVYDCLSCFRHSYAVLVKGEDLKRIANVVMMLLLLLTGSAEAADPVSITTYPPRFVVWNRNVEARVTVRIEPDERNSSFCLMWQHEYPGDGGASCRSLDSQSQRTFTTFIRRFVPGTTRFYVVLHRGTRELRTQTTLEVVGGE